MATPDPRGVALRPRRYVEAAPANFIPITVDLHGRVGYEPDPQARANRTWGEHDYVAQYAHRRLRPVEVTLLLRHGHALRGRVLELGCGAGRLSGYLIELAGTFLGLDISTRMVEHCRRAYPDGSFDTGDLRDLSGIASGSWDAVVASFNVIDVLDDARRHAFLAEMQRTVAPGGLFIFSSHNEGAAASVPTRPELRWRDPFRLAVDLTRYPRRARNHRRRAADEVHAGDYAIRNDAAHDFALLHYYIARDAQEAQLREHGFELVECLDLDARRVAPGEPAAHAGELHYVARRSG